MSFDPVDFARQSIKYFVDKDEPNPDDYSRVNYILRGDGLWEVRQNKIGRFCVHRFTGSVSGFPEEHNLEEGFELSLPKIPRKLLDQIVAFFRRLTEDHDFEAYVQIFWNPEEEKYFLFCPEQKVSKGRVRYEPSELISKNVLVCEIHSHNSMPAFFSNVDDDDEKKRGDRFFGVVGNLHTLSPTIKLSFIIGGGKRVFLEVEDLFKDEPFPSEWLDKITYIDRKQNSELQKHSRQPKFPSRQPYWQGGQSEMFSGEEEYEENEEDGDWEYEEDDGENEDIYDNMNLVTIEDLEQLADWTGDPSEVSGVINHMLANQEIVGSKEED